VSVANRDGSVSREGAKPRREKPFNHEKARKPRNRVARISEAPSGKDLTRSREEGKPPTCPLFKGGVGEADGGLQGCPPKAGGGLLKNIYRKERKEKFSRGDAEARRKMFPSPLVGEGSGERGERIAFYFPLSRPSATLSRKGRGLDSATSLCSAQNDRDDSRMALRLSGLRLLTGRV